MIALDDLQAMSYAKLVELAGDAAYDENGKQRRKADIIATLSGAAAPPEPPPEDDGPPAASVDPVAPVASVKPVESIPAATPFKEDDPLAKARSVRVTKNFHGKDQDGKTLRLNFRDVYSYGVHGQRRVEWIKSRYPHLLEVYPKE